MSQLTKKRVVYDFRQEDILNRGQGAPLTPIFHNLLSKNIIKKNNINFPICFLNIGGISNITKINKNVNKISATKKLCISVVLETTENESCPSPIIVYTATTEPIN